MMSTSVDLLLVNKVAIILYHEYNTTKTSTISEPLYCHYYLPIGVDGYIISMHVSVYYVCAALYLAQKLLPCVLRKSLCAMNVKTDGHTDSFSAL